MPTLDLGVIGNCSIAALVDFRARILWSCFPRFDGDPTFCALVNSPSEGEEAPETQTGLFAIESARIDVVHRAVTNVRKKVQPSHEAGRI